MTPSAALPAQGRELEWGLPLYDPVIVYTCVPRACDFGWGWSCGMSMEAILRRFWALTFAYLSHSSISIQNHRHARTTLMHVPIYM